MSETGRASTWARPGLVLVGLMILASGCGLGAEDAKRTLSVRFDNESDEYRYVALVRGTTTLDEALRDLALEGIAPGESAEFAAGPTARTPASDLCFDREQFWVVRSLSATPWWRSWEEQFKPPRDTADFEVVEHLPSDTCSSESTLLVTLE